MSPRTSAGPADALGGLISSLISRLNLVELLAHRHAGTGQVMPTGTVLDFSGSSAPGGYVLCDGATYDGTNSAYADLFAVIGLTYGGSGTNFQVPDLRGRVSAGRDAGQTEFDVLGETGGAKTHTLATTEIPAHTHTQNAHTHTQDAHTHTQNAHTHTQNAHNHGATAGASGNATGFVLAVPAGTGAATFNIGGVGGGNALVLLATNDANTANSIATNQNTTATNQNTTATNQNATATNQNTGGGGAHNNLQPYLTLNKIIRL